ncbi:MAG: eukaryotic-like serine/threonine-protein kinase, partial [Solirubrobacteraceae bacterium]|nr:eukaryotic-like serine/threonine-protein kinase [Solirubrobacteraceae bacterium]
MSLDGYDVIRELGRGGMAVVHLARQRDLGRLVALKELAGLNAGDPAFTERFLRESRVAGSLNHQNIVTVYEYFEDGGVPFIAMELIEGGSLRPLVGDLSLPQVARVLDDLLAAVGHAGRNGIVHRDLKPENALITQDGHVKVADFGIAKAAASGQQGLTSEGMTVGTPEYMSPEQAMARDVSPASDLYSVGCMTYEMLTGRLPFTESSQTALLLRQVSDPVPDVREIDPLIPEPVALWVATMTAKDPDERFASAQEAWESFEEAILEFVGPRWRRDATLTPGSEIDVDDIPPQGAKPLRPATRASLPASGALTGFQTYHAPAALHEQLAAEGVDASAAAVVTPPATATPARRVATPAPQHATPAPVAAPAPVAKPAAPEPAAEPGPEPRGLPVPAIAAAAVVAAIVAFVVGISGGKPASVASASGDGFVLKAPSGWVTTGAPTVPALGAGAVALAPPGAGGGEAIAAARMPAAGAAALARSAGAPQQVHLSAGDAVRHGAALFVLPTSDGTIVVSCTAGPQVRAACGSAAASLQLQRGRARALGPTADGARIA